MLKVTLLGTGTSGGCLLWAVSVTCVAVLILRTRGCGVLP